MSEKDTLEQFGWGPAMEKAAARYTYEEEGLIRARVTEARRSSWVVVADLGQGPQELTAAASGRLLRNAAVQADRPATGDWVLIRPGEAAGGGTVLIRAVMPRYSRFSRKAPGDAAHDRVAEQVVAANIDIAFIVVAAGGDWSPRRIERYVTLAWESGARPVVAVAKADLAEDPEELVLEGRAAAPGADVFAFSARTGYGMDAFASYLIPGKTAVLLGSSGAGKSTLLNVLAGSGLQKTREVREDDHRGRHTTTARTLFRLPSGALVIDTPGLREVQLWTDADGVDAAFSDVEAAAARCRFRNCTHEGEPGCGVREALDAGVLAEERLESWRKLRREAAYLERRGDHAAEAEEKAKWKAIHKSMRNFHKANKGLR